MRPTFHHNYFQDKYEVVEYIFTHEVLEPMRPFLQSGLVKEAFHFMIVAIQKDSAFYRREIMRSSQNSFRDILGRSMHDFLLPIIRERIGEPKHPFLTAENITEYYINNFLFVLTKWLVESPEIPVDQIMEVYELLVSSSLSDLLSPAFQVKAFCFPHAIFYFTECEKKKSCTFKILSFAHMTFFLFLSYLYDSFSILMLFSLFAVIHNKKHIMK